MGLKSWIVNAGGEMVGRVLGGGNEIIRTLKGSQAERDAQDADRFTAGMAAYAAEWNGQGWWNRFWDGINRMPRPLLLVLILCYFVLAYIDPIEFQVLNTTLGTVPETMWEMLKWMVGFYFLAREIQKGRDKKMALSPAAFAEVQRRIAELRGGEQDPPPVATMGEGAVDVRKEDSVTETMAGYAGCPEPAEPPWYTLAKQEMEAGVAEIAGDEHNPRILEYHQTTTLKADDDEKAWCSAFINWCVEMTGVKGSGSAAARSWLQWGFRLMNPRLGCVVVFSRGRNPAHGHVGFYVGEADGKVMVVGGNQGDQVSVAGYAKDRVLGYRWPREGIEA